MYTDRTISCLDCGQEFSFTAGEQEFCAECGKTASVPFRPTGAKPVYCSDCFQGRR